jgi:hypothetical protein
VCLAFNVQNNTNQLLPLNNQIQNLTNGNKLKNQNKADSNNPNIFHMQGIINK